MELNFISVETIPVLNASAAFKTDSGKVFKEDKNKKQANGYWF